MAASTTILSALHNSGINDLINMLNTAWPLSVGLGVAGQIGSWDALTAKGTTVASSSTLVLTTATGPRIDISGTTSITAVTLADGTMRFARATGIFTLAAGASLLVNGSATVSYTTKVGDFLIFQADGSVISVTTLTPLGIETIALAPSANQDNYATTASPNAAKGTVIVISPTISIKLTGISTSGWETGKPVTIRNGTSLAAASGRLIILERNSASSSAANRFQFAKSDRDRSPIFLMPGDEVTFRFDGTDLKIVQQLPVYSRWDAVPNVQGNAFWSGTAGTAAANTFNQTELDGSGNAWFYGDHETGSTNAGVAGNGSAHPTQLRGGVGAMICVSGVNVPVLSTGVEEFTVFVGFNDLTNTPAAPVDAVGWQYKRTSSVNWQTYSRSNSTETLVAQSNAVNAAVYILLGVFMNGDASRADFFYSTDLGETWTFVAAITSNLPTGSARAFGVATGIVKTVGTTTRHVRQAGTLHRWLQ